ncbi:MAG: DUF389 domain-containing protein [Bacteroidota bacterium]
MNPTEPTPKHQNLWQATVEWFDDFFDLREGMDREGATASIKQGRFMRGSNAWMLVCSIMIASLGLNLNSGAVIIGAMLISPLMNPILGIGLGVATNDREILWGAVRHFFIAIAIALVTSVLYFLVTPLREFTPEMQGRTEPTILDGMVAIFGGLAGIISVTRADKTNAIPGVAIATALMPPLCVSGYGIATMNWEIAARSFYLFFLNSFFIATTAYLIIRLLRFPYKKYVNDKEARRSRLLIMIFSIIIIIPSLFILRQVLKNVRFERNVNSYVENVFGNSCVEHQVIEYEGKDSSLLVMELINREIPPDSLEFYQEILRQPPYSVENVSILAIPDYSLSMKRLSQLQGQQVSSLDNINAELEAMKNTSKEQAEEKDRLRTQLKEYRMDSSAFLRLNQQLKLAFPTIEQVAISRAQSSQDSSLVEGLPLVAIKRPALRSRSANRDELARIEAYLKTSLEVDTLQLVSY